MFTCYLSGCSLTSFLVLPTLLHTFLYVDYAVEFVLLDLTPVGLMPTLTSSKIPFSSTLVALPLGNVFIRTSLVVSKYIIQLGSNSP